MLTVRTTGFDPAAATGGSAAIETPAAVAANAGVTFLGSEIAKNDRPELTAAKIIVSGGRGMGSSQAFSIIESLADKLGAAVGASRAAVDAGFISNDHQVGQTGKIVAPDLYIACGISGAIQHIVGCKAAKRILVINTDPDAPIFGRATYAVIGDVHQVVPAIAAEIRRVQS